MTHKTVDRKFIRSLNPCPAGYEWYLRNCAPREKSYVVAQKLMDQKEFDWANWFISRTLCHKDKIRYAVYAAEQVIDIYESEYEDDRPRKAIGS